MKLILFNEQMRPKVIDGTKNQTRRVFREITDRQLKGGWLNVHDWYNVEGTNEWWCTCDGAPLGPFKAKYQVGDICGLQELLFLFVIHLEFVKRNQLSDLF